MSANRTAHRVYAGTLFQGTGPPFDAVPFPALGAPGGASGAPVGTGTLTFTDANNATFPTRSTASRRPRRSPAKPSARCRSCLFGAQVNLALARNYQDLWWAAPAGSEAGWGINLTHEGDTIFATWYTYDHDRSPMWLVTTATKSGLSSYTGDLIRLTSGPPFNAVPFPPIGSAGGASGSVVGNCDLEFLRRQLGNLQLQRRRRRAEQEHHSRSICLARDRLSLKATHRAAAPVMNRRALKRRRESSGPSWRSARLAAPRGSCRALAHAESPAPSAPGPSAPAHAPRVRAQSRLF